VFKERLFALGIAAPALVFIGLLATAAFAAPLRPFDGQFTDGPCRSGRPGELKLCGTGTISLFGSVTSTIVLRLRATSNPRFAGCLTGTGTRTLTFAKKKNTLRLAIRGLVCGPRGWGTFTIVTGTGVFSNAKGQGVTWGTVQHVRYYGVITLAK
jgi:hypothetical protein